MRLREKDGHDGVMRWSQDEDQGSPKYKDPGALESRVELVWREGTGRSGVVPGSVLMGGC